jgi:hypothetical protein
LLGSGFQRRTFLFFWVPDPGLSYQLLTVTTPND